MKHPSEESETPIRENGPNPDSVKRPSLANLPSINAILQEAIAVEMIHTFGRERTKQWAKDCLEQIRQQTARSDTPPERDHLMQKALDGLAARAKTERARGSRQVINATGVILHTNLGRAPLAKAAIAKIEEVAGYTNLEIDLTSGQRGGRGASLEQKLCELSRAEAALAVNNCAAATLLVLNTFAAGGEVVISRGQLIEIGGSYRLPDVFTAAGVTLREVGTTNKTYLSDYECGLNENTRAILKVHPSNYAIVGFVESVPIKPLAELAHQRELFAIDDLGSGCFYDLSAFGLPHEPCVQDSIKHGADLVLFSGDKLLGGPQAGVIVGRERLIEQIRKNPLARAMRLDKTILAALEATLEIHIAGKAFEDIPVLHALAIPVEELQARAEKLRTLLKERGLPGQSDRLQVALRRVPSLVGGGSLSNAEIPSWALAVSGVDVEEIAKRLRVGVPAVLPRLERNELLFDLRTLAADEDELLLERLLAVLEHPVPERSPDFAV